MTELSLQPNPGDGVDNWLRSGVVDDNFGTEASMTTGVQTIKSTAISRFVVRFPLNSIPAGSIIDDATLTLFHKVSDGLSATLFYFNRLIRDDWTELGSTWIDPWTTAGGDFTPTDRSAATISTGEDLIFNDAGMVAQCQYAVDSGGGSLEGLTKIDDESEGTHAIEHYSSDEATETDKRPKLVINYTAPLITVAVAFASITGVAVGFADATTVALAFASVTGIAIGFSSVTTAVPTFESVTDVAVSFK